MPARRIRVELLDTEGNRYTVSFEGQITRDKAVRLLDLVELLGGAPASGNFGSNANNVMIADSTLSKCEKVRTLAKKQFPLVWFTSHEIQTAYEQEYKQPISLSTVATYLARFTNKGILLKAGASNSLKYKMTPNLSTATLKQQIP